MSPGEIHEDHPFRDPPEERDPARQLRGRLAAPVTIVTSGGPDDRTGLTISSIVVAEGEPASVHFLLGPATDLRHALDEHGTFIVHVAQREHRELADRFSLIRPSPGGLFAGLDVTDTEYGPELTVMETRAYCRYFGHRRSGHALLMEGVIEDLGLHDLTDPLCYFRGQYGGV